ncbi:MAG: hypothetical protein IKN65_04445 [Clostridia bacterium]|nr:hypothetical protein [Clostridia bacterium]
MYTTTVKIRKILGGKPALKMLVPLGIWVILILTSFIIGVKVTPLALLIMIIIFFMIIPITYYMRKSTDEFRGEESFINKKITFNVINGELYADNIKLNVTQNKARTKIIVDNISIITTPRYKAKTYMVRFLGIVEEPYVDGFVKFLIDNGVKIKNR